MKLSDLIIEHGPYIGGSFEALGHTITATDLNELRDELMAARKASEGQERFEVSSVGLDGDVELRHTPCGWSTDIEGWNAQRGQLTLAELNQRAGEHAEVRR